jgi:hypothetical protein
MRSKSLVFLLLVLLGRFNSFSQRGFNADSLHDSELEYLAMLCFGEHLACSQSQISFAVFEKFCKNGQKLLSIDTLENNIEMLEVYKIRFNKQDSFRSLYSSDTLIFKNFLFNQVSTSAHCFNYQNGQISKVIFKYHGYFLPIVGFRHTHLYPFFEMFSIDESENKKGEFYPIKFVFPRRFSRQASLKKLVRRKYIEGISLRCMYKKYRKGGKVEDCLRYDENH